MKNLSLTTILYSSAAVITSQEENVNEPWNKFHNCKNVRYKYRK